MRHVPSLNFTTITQQLLLNFLIQMQFISLSVFVNLQLLMYSPLHQQILLTLPPMPVIYTTTPTTATAAIPSISHLFPAAAVGTAAFDVLIDVTLAVVGAGPIRYS